MIGEFILSLERLPTSEQWPRIERFLKEEPEPAFLEEWNTAFGARSLFSAWTSTTIAQRIYKANAEVISQHLGLKEELTICEIGAGDGELYRHLPRLGGTLYSVDPEPSAHEALRQTVGERFEVKALLGSVQSVELPKADVIVCSLTLHHVAGSDRAQRAKFGLEGEGKVECLQKMSRALKPGGILLLNEADIFCDLPVPSNSELLTEHLVDSYVRRCAKAIVEEDLSRLVSDELKQRWRVMLRRWFLQQPLMALKPVIERDVYELTVDRWLKLLWRSGLKVVDHRFTDPQRLFHQYRCVGA